MTDHTQETNALNMTTHMRTNMTGLRVLVTAGPTREPIDPIRFISNGSSGKMGYALAQASEEAGACVTLISGPVGLAKPPNIHCISVLTALEMYEAVMQNIVACDLFLAVAAVGDYRCKTVAAQKIHKSSAPLALELVPNPDIVDGIAVMPDRPFIVGFAAETENVLEQAEAKRKRKKMNIIIANRVGQGKGMGTEDNEVVLLSERGSIHLPLMPKPILARQLMALIMAEYELNMS